MWCNNHGQVSKIPTDPRATKLRPIMPRPFPNTFPTTPTTTTPSCYPNNNLKIPSWNHLLSGYGGKREMMSTVPFVSSRWNPTREQLQALEEMYRNGIRTPSAQQIQQIAAKLRRFGKIEGKNVFYWFQNHKARERQKKRRQMESNTRDINNAERPDKTQSDHGVSRTYLETKHPRKLPTPSSCSTSSEYSASMQGAVVQECKQEKWDCKELQEHNLTAKRIETWWPLDLSFCMPLNSNNNNNNKVTQQDQENEKPFVANKLLAATKNKTLQLFPVRSNYSSDVKVNCTEEDYDVSTVGPKSGPPNKFFEFLPTKY